MAENSNSGASGFERLQLDAAAFSVTPAQQAQTSASTTGVSARAGQSGGNVRSGVVLPDAQPVAGWGELGRVIDGIMAPKLKAAQGEQFWKGVVAARSGQAIKEIVETDDPLSKIFGPSAFVQGAQFYTAQDKIAGFNQSMLENVGELAKLPPEQLGQALNAKSQQFETGDAGSDALIHASMLDQTAPTLNIITKRRYADQQETAVQAFSSNATTVAGNLAQVGSYMAEGTATQDDYLYSQQILAASLGKPEGMSEESYRALLPAWTLQQADKGNFHAVDMVKRSGVLNYMDTAARTKLEERLDAQAKQGAETYRNQHVRELSYLTAGIKAGTLTPEEFVKQLDVEQKRFYERTGNTSPLLPTYNLVVEGRGNWFEAQKAAAREGVASAKAAATLEEQRQADARTMEQITSMVTTGSAGDATHVGFPQVKVTAAMTKAWDQYLPEERDQLITNNYVGSAYVDPVIRTRLQAPFRTTSDDAAPVVLGAYGDWKRLMQTPEGQSTAAAYYSEDQQTRLAKLDMLKNSGWPDALAYKEAFQTPLTAQVDWEKTHGIDKTVRSIVEERFDQWFPNKQNLDETGKRLVAGLVMKQVGVTRQNTALTDEQATQQALHRTMANGLEVYGGYAWTRDRDQQPLNRYIRSKNNNGSYDYNAIPDGILDKVFGAYTKTALEAAGAKDVETYQVIRLGDAGGEAQFAVMGFQKSGQVVPVQFSSRQLSEAYEQKLYRKKEAAVRLGIEGAATRRTTQQQADSAYWAGWDQ